MAKDDYFVIVADRLKREREKYADYETLKNQLTVKKQIKIPTNP